LAKEAEILAKKKKTGQENAFIKIAPCLKEVLSLKYKSSGWDADNLSDCYLKNKINPNTFRQSIDGKLIYNKTQVHEAGDELSKLIDLVEDHTPTKESFGQFEKLKGASELKKKLEGGELSKLKDAETFLNREFVNLKKFDFKVDMKLKDHCSNHLIDLAKINPPSPSSEPSVEIAKDLIGSLTKEEQVPIELSKEINSQDVCAVFKEMAKNGSCSEGSAHSTHDSCKEEKTDLEKVISHTHSCSEKQSHGKNLLGVNCSTVEVSSLVKNQDKVQDLKKLKKLILQHLMQELALGVKIGDEKSTLVGMKESSGVCGFLLKDTKKKELTWISESDFITKAKELNILQRISRTEDTYEQFKVEK